jgi:hypothetical protein
MASSAPSLGVPDLNCADFGGVEETQDSRPRAAKVRPYFARNGAGALEHRDR